MTERRGRKPASSMAERKRNQRARHRESGLVPVEVWIPRRHRPVLRRLEALLRQDIVPELPRPYHVTASGERVMDLNMLRESLNGLTTENGFHLSASESDGDVVEIVVEDREEFPIVVSTDEEQVLCLTYLFDDSQVKADSRTEMLSTMLEMNVPLPLSSFGKVGARYVIFGALAANCTVQDVITEIEVLSDNTLEAIEAVGGHLA
jgi:uncharacterized protein YjfI (DUF2170 family)